MNTDNLTGGIIGCAMRVSNTLGAGFLEKVYENALIIELKKAGLKAEQQKSIEVHYDGIVVGQFTADLLVNDQVILQLKAVKLLDEVHKAQRLNYLRATGIRIGLLLNFGTPRLGVRRLVL